MFRGSRVIKNIILYVLKIELCIVFVYLGYLIGYTVLMVIVISQWKPVPPYGAGLPEQT